MASLLDLFTIGFGSEGLKEFETELKNNEKELDKYEKQTKELEQKLRELEAAEKKDAKAIAQTGKALQEAKDKAEFFKKSVEKLKNSSQNSFLQLKNSAQNLVKSLGALAFIGAAVRRSLDFYEQGEQLDFLAQKTGIAVEKLQLLGNAAKKYGGTTEGTAGTIENLRQQYQNARMGNVSGGMKTAYMKYGFQISSDPEQTLSRLAKRMESMKSDVAKWDLAKSLGIDEGTTRLLIQGQAKYNEELKRASKYKLYTKEDIERMRDYRQISQDIRMGIENIFAIIYRALLPVITKVSKAIRTVTDWLSEHEGAVKLAAAVTAITAALLLLKPILMGIGAVIGALSPEILAIIALITLITAAVQDFIVFLEGGDSIIGDFLEAIGVDVDEARQNCLNFFASIKAGIKTTIDWIKSLGGKFAELASKIKSIWDAIPDFLKTAIQSIINVNPAFAPVAIGQQMIGTYNNNKLNSVPSGATANYYQTQAINDTSTKNSKTVTNSQSKVTNIGTINVSTQASDPTAVSREIFTLAQSDNGRQA